MALPVAVLGACAAVSGLSEYGPEGAGTSDGGDDLAVDAGLPSESDSPRDGGPADDVFEGSLPADSETFDDAGDGASCPNGSVSCGESDAGADAQPDAASDARADAISDAASDSGTDTGTDARPAPDGAPDGGCIALPPEVNVHPADWGGDFKSAPTWNCSNSSGTTVIDSKTGSVSGDSCGGTAALDSTNSITQTAAGGPSVLVIRLRGLTVTNRHLVQLRGDKPIIFLVAGDVLVDSGGQIDASASGTTAGPGGSIAANCGTSTGTNAATNLQGGGGGGFGTTGGAGANVTGTNAGGGVPSGNHLLPLRGGCSGGTALVPSVPGGAGGGAFEISASGMITIGTGSNTAILSAAGGYSPGSTSCSSCGSAGAGSGGGILLVSPSPAVFGSGGAARAHGGGSGSGLGASVGAGNPGANGHTLDDMAAAGGASPASGSPQGAAGGLCSGNNCSLKSATGSNGALLGSIGSGGGGGGGFVQVITGATTVVCD